MKSNNEQKGCECFAIYGYLHPEDFQVEHPGYYLLYVFDGKGMSDLDMLKDLYREIRGSELDLASTRGMVGPFDGVKSIDHFIHELCLHVPGNAICLVSREDYNQSLESVSEASELLDKLLESGQLVQNEDGSELSGLWGRFFSRR